MPPRPPDIGLVQAPAQEHEPLPLLPSFEELLHCLAQVHLYEVESLRSLLCGKGDECHEKVPAAGCFETVLSSDSFPVAIPTKSSQVFRCSKNSDASPYLRPASSVGCVVDGSIRTSAGSDVTQHFEVTVLRPRFSSDKEVMLDNATRSASSDMIIDNATRSVESAVEHCASIKSSQPIDNEEKEDYQTHKPSRRTVRKYVFQKTFEDENEESKEEESKKPECMITVIDFIVACAILLNCLVLGISSDIQWDYWEVFEYLFALVFFLEVLIKMYIWGMSQYFCGKDWYWNFFDILLVLFSVADGLAKLFLLLFHSGGGRDDMSNLGEYSILKLFRVGRLARFVRLLRFKIFHELKQMLLGVFAGLRVLFWAIVLFFSFLYVVGLCIRTILGDDGGLYVRRAFHTLPWTMFTLFRCFTDGCSAHDGTPLTVHLFHEYGGAFMITYMLSFLFVSVGLFNLIMAMFVDSVMATTKKRGEQNRQADRARLSQELRTQVKLALLSFEEAFDSTASLTSDAKQHDPTKTRSMFLGKFGSGLMRFSIGKQDSQASIFLSQLNKIDSDGNIEISREQFRKLLDCQSLEKLFKSLDISVQDPGDLFDVLDADSSGLLSLDELVDGVLNLSGPAEKGDTVAALLKARSILKTVQRLQRDMDSVRAVLLDPRSSYATTWLPN